MLEDLPAIYIKLTNASVRSPAFLFLVDDASL